MLTSYDLRPQSPWLVLGISFIIVLTVISLTLAWPAGGAALNDRPPDTAMTLGNYQSPQRCRECHEPEFQAWTSTTHAQASFDPIFQTYLQAEQEPGECFSCHATGYNTNTGQFVLAGVTCEACHGPYRAGHPAESMRVAASADLCGHCHTSTLQEWSASRHGQVGVSCIACHEVHTQKTRAVESTNSLCAGCHKELAEDPTHVAHRQLEIHCVDCHLARPDGTDRSDAVKGHAITGHSFTVAVAACRECHDASSPLPSPGAVN